MTIDKTRQDAKANRNEHTKRDAKADPIVGKSKTEEIAGKLTGTGRGNHDERQPGAEKSKYVGADAVGGVREGTGKMKKGGERDDAGGGEHDDDDDAITLDGQGGQGSEKAPKGRDA